MTNAAPGAAPEEPAGFWSTDRRHVALGAVASLVAAAIFAAFGAAFAAFFHIKFTVGAFQALLAAALVAAIVVIACFVAIIAQSRKVTMLDSARRVQIAGLHADVTTRLDQHGANITVRLDEVTSEIGRQLDELQSSIPSVDWSYDAAELNSDVYGRVLKVVEQPGIKTFKIVTIFRDVKYDDYSPDQRRAVQGYYTALENALARERAGFTYERVVLVRGPVRGQMRNASSLFRNLVEARPEFIEHYRNICKPGGLGRTLGNHADIKIYGAESRLADVSFGVALDGQERPLTVTLEFGITAPPVRPGEVPRRALGLITLDKPDAGLVKALLQAHESIRDNKVTGISPVPERELERVLGGRA
jgi:hypothetical protein